MYDLRRTQGRALFKDLLGQANHFLITILIGLNGVRRGVVGHDPEFHAAWNPRDVKASSDRSRIFALDLALVRAVDALDAYMMRSRRRPLALEGDAFIQQMDGAGQSVASRLAIFCQNLPPLPEEQRSFLELAIDWRNRRVHSMAGSSITKEQMRTLQRHSDQIADEYRGLDIEALLVRYKDGEAPTFKEAASIIGLVQRAVSHFDDELLQRLEVQRYVREALSTTLFSFEARTDAELKRICIKTWDEPRKRRAKVLRALRWIGIHEATEVIGREVPVDLVDKIAAMTSDEALAYLRT